MRSVKEAHCDFVHGAHKSKKIIWTKKVREGGQESFPADGGYDIHVREELKIFRGQVFVFTNEIDAAAAAAAT